LKRRVGDSARDGVRAILRDGHGDPELVVRQRRKLGREPEEKEIAAEMGVSVPEYEKTLEQLRMLDIGAIRSLDAPTEDGTSRIELCVDPGEGVAQQLERKELKLHLARAIEQLPERERQILALYFEEELTLAEIGQVIGVGESRVSQLRSLALSRLRTLLRESLGNDQAAAVLATATAKAKARVRK
jgi:RNA polymerase sigma factor for flagellar operon FliA